MNLIPAQIGDPVDHIETPALVVDLDAFGRNVERMAGFGRETGMRVRPHAKTHKCPSAQHLPTFAERETAIARAADAIRVTREALDHAGLTCAIVSGAGTGTFRLESATGLWNELQVGSYVFMDTEYARIGAKNGGRYTEFEHGLYVMATVMSVPSAEYVVVDAGLKSYSCEKGMPWVHGRDDVSVVGVSDEHGKLQVGPKATGLRLGDRVMLVPGHCDPTVNLHDWQVGIRNGKVEVLWPINARGASI